MHICTLRDLVAEGATAAIEADADVARLKSSADLVKVIEAAVRFYEKPPAKPMAVETDWSDIWLSVGDWAEAFGAPEAVLRTTRRAARYSKKLVTILVDKRDDNVPADELRKSLLQNRELITALNRAWPPTEVDHLVGDLWSVPAYLRMCAPWLSPDDIQKLQRPDAQAWTVSDPPVPGRCPAAARRPAGHPASAPARRGCRRRTRADDPGRRQPDRGRGRRIRRRPGHSMLRGEDFQDALINEAALPSIDPDLLGLPVRAHRRGRGSGTDRRGQPGRCCCSAACPGASPSSGTGPRPGTGSRSRGGNGSSGSGSTRSTWLPSASTTGRRKRSWRRPSRSSGPCSRTPTRRPPSAAQASPSSHGPTSDRGPILDVRLAAHARDGIACVISNPPIQAGQSLQAMSRVRPLTPDSAVQGARVRPGRPRRPRGVRHGHRRSSRPLCCDDPGDPSQSSSSLVPDNGLGARRRIGRGARCA